MYCADWYNKDKIVLSKLLDIIKNQESAKEEIKDTIHDEAQIITEKIDDTDGKVQQVQDTADTIGNDVRGMRDDVNHRLNEISYQNECLYNLASRSLTQGRYSTPQKQIRYPQREIAYHDTPGSSPYVMRAQSVPFSNEQTPAMQRRSYVRQSQVICAVEEVTPQRQSGGSGWLGKFGF